MQTSKSDTPQLAKGSERIPVVEDEEGLREISVSMLRNQGYKVTEVKNGKEATKQLMNGEPFDLLFTDVVLPG